MMLITLISNDTIGVPFSMATSDLNATKAQCTYPVGNH